MNKKNKNRKHRTINVKNIGWLVSTTMFFTIVYPFIGYCFWSCINTGGLKTIKPIIWISVFITAYWYWHRNKKVGYLFQYWYDWHRTRSDKKHAKVLQARHEEWLNSPEKARWDAEMRRLEIQEYRNEHEHGKIAK